MEAMSNVICDTDVIIEFLKGHHNLDTKFQEYGYDRLALSSITIMELYVGAFNKREIQKIAKALQLLKIIHITENISAKSISLIERYSKSSGLQLPDAIIAATSIENNMPLFTFNTKDFKNITGLKIIKL